VITGKFERLRISASMRNSLAFDLAFFKSRSFVDARCQMPSTLKRHCQMLLRSRLLSLIEIMEPPMIEFMGPFFHRFLPPAGT